MCTVNIRGHVANFCEAKADATRPRSRPRPERVRPRLRPRPNDFASRPHGPRCLNIPGCYRRSVDCVCVCLLDTTARPTKTDGPIGMLFELWTRVGPGNHVFCGGRNRTRGMGNFRGCFPYSNALCKLYEQQTPGDSASRRAYSYKMDSPAAGVTSAGAMRPFVRLL